MNPEQGAKQTAWQSEPEPPHATSIEASRILLLIDNRGNRQQIVQQLGEHYKIIWPYQDSLPYGNFDLAITDGPGLSRWHDALAEIKSSEQPVFLPVIVILPQKELRNRTTSLASIIDDFVTIPVNRDEFLHRINILLRARRQALEQRDELVRIINYDRTTGLPNRHLFTEQIASRLESNEAHTLNLYVVVVHIPLDRILETVGERAVEEAARICSRLLREVIDDEAILARLSMKNWAIQLPVGTPMEYVLGLCSRIDRIASEPIEAGDESLRVKLKIGVASCPDDATTAAELIDTAITASSRARDREPAFYAPDQRDAALHYLRTEARLHDALAGEQFELWLQPKLALQSNEINSAEALIRWRLPSGDMVSPGDFIPVAETSGFIHDITNWVIRTAVNILSEKPANFRIAVNITPTDIQQENFLTWLHQLCVENAISPGSIELELTETMICDMDEQTIDRLRNLRQIGFMIAIDDFGTGYSSLSFLHRLPVNKLKIDKRFIDDVPGNSSGAAVTRTIINLAQEFGLETVAEGIENKEQLDYLRVAKVDYGQGFYIARPMPVDVFDTWITNRN